MDRKNRIELYERILQKNQQNITFKRYEQAVCNVRKNKIFPTINEVIKESGLKDGMTISFHHAFRDGDYVVNYVMKKISEMGIKKLKLCCSSLNSCHSPLIEYIEKGIIDEIYTSGIRGQLAEAISDGILKKPVHIHSHGGRVHLIQSGVIHIDVAFLSVAYTDDFGNASGYGYCGSLGYAQVDAQYSEKVCLLTEKIVDYPLNDKSIHQDEVDYIVQVDQVGDPKKIGSGSTRLTKNPRDLLIAKHTAKLIFNSGYFKDGFSLQTGSGGAALAVTRFIEDKMIASNITASFALGGITASMVRLHEKGLIKKLLDVQSFDQEAALSLKRNENHIEISANEYANFSSKGASVNKLNIIILSALEIDVGFNVNVITGSDGKIMGASGGHSDTAASADLVIVVCPLIRGRIPTVIDKVTTCITPGYDIDVLVTDHGIAINPLRKDLIEKLSQSGIKLTTIDKLYEQAISMTGKPKAIEFTDVPIGLVYYRDGSILDVIYKVKK